MHVSEYWQVITNVTYQTLQDVINNPLNNIVATKLMDTDDLNIVSNFMEANSIDFLVNYITEDIANANKDKKGLLNEIVILSLPPDEIDFWRGKFLKVGRLVAEKYKFQTIHLLLNSNDSIEVNSEKVKQFFKENDFFIENTPIKSDSYTPTIYDEWIDNFRKEKPYTFQKLEKGFGFSFIPENAYLKEEHEICFKNEQKGLILQIYDSGCIRIWKNDTTLTLLVGSSSNPYSRDPEKYKQQLSRSHHSINNLQCITNLLVD